MSLPLRTPALLAAVTLLAAAGPAAAQSGGASPTAATSARPAAKGPSAAGRAVAAARPVVDAITCRTACAGIDAGAPGSQAMVSGRGMDAVTQVVLLGGRGARDDRVVTAVPLSHSAAAFTIPAGARTGPVRAVAGSTRSAASRRRLLVGRPGAAPRRGPLLQVRSDVARAFAGAITPSVSFFVRSATPLAVTVDLIRAGDGASVARWVLPSVPGRSTQGIAWTGVAADTAEGRYLWRVLPAREAAALAGPGASGGASAAAATATPLPGFALVRHLFPIAGPHTYGTGAGRFGAGRAGHTHQGQDVFAACGTPLVANTSGTIKMAGYDANGGNYLVLAGDDGRDYAYMHLKDKVALAKGQAVTIGQPVGRVGDTGDAVGCHLHFEIWPAPGWWSGGSPIDPLPTLRSWDD